ncbi:MAG: hypothetical protein RLZZ37_977 [Actinomycetota bacterium]|jgi:mannose-6-phosphate isomerase
MNNNVLVVKGSLKDYLWGKVNGLSKWNTNTDKPQAELWFGDHESSPSVLVENNQIINSKSNFPLLVKILCAAEPLSIQVHPDKETAQEKYEQYGLSDSHGKDEMLFALEHFLAYAGIRNSKKVQEIFKILANDSKIENLKELIEHKSFKESANIIFNLNNDEILKANKILKSNLPSLNISFSEQNVLDKIISKYPNDPGVLICLLMQFHELKKGDAIHVKPGTPHSYVSGLAIEVMTSSDNVLRMGLTNKPIKVQQALELVVEHEVQVLSLPTNDGIHVYKPEANFELIAIDNAKKMDIDAHYSCVLNIEGKTKLKVDSKEIELQIGQAALILMKSFDIEVIGHAFVARTV